MLPFVEKLNDILRSVCEHLGISVLIGKRVKGDDILPLKNIFYFAIKQLILKISQFSLPATSTLKSR